MQKKETKKPSHEHFILGQLTMLSLTHTEMLHIVCELFHCFLFNAGELLSINPIS